MLYLADSDIQLSQMDEARTLLERLVKLSPANSMAHRDLGVVYADAGRNRDALAEFQTAIRLKPDDVNAHYRLGRLYRAMGRNADAKAEFDKSKKLNEAADEGLIKVMSRVPQAATPPAAPSAATAPEK
jgi:tetratricopeptide (TPR) repeat protein